MMKAIGLIAMAGVAAIVTACSTARAEDPGPETSKNYRVSSFDQIEVAGPYDVKVHTGPAVSISAKGPQKMLERMVVEVKGSKLMIYTRRENGSLNWGGQRGHVELSVTVPELRAAQIAGSGDVHVDRVAGNSFNGGIGGSGDLALDSVEVQTLNLAIGGSGNVRAAQGRAQMVSLDIAGSGDIDAGGVVAQTASASIAGSGNIAAQATRTASINIMGSGDVQLSGGAKCTISKAGSGTVTCS